MLAKLTKALNQKFSKIKRQSPIMLFASAPVGFPTLKILNNYFENLSVVTHYTSKNSNHKNEVQNFCRNTAIPIYFPVKKQESKEQKQREWEQFVAEVGKMQKKPVLGIVCAYGYMIPDNVINLFEKGMILAHPSLIPKYRGGAPIFHVIANGQRQSGVSFLEVSKNKFDHGNMLYQVKCHIGEHDNYEKVQKQMSELIADQVINVIQNLDSLRPGKSQAQMSTENIPPHQLQARINRDKSLNVNMKAQQIYNWSRALITPRVKFNNQQIIPFFQKKFLPDPENQYKPGQIKHIGKELYMKASDMLIKVSMWQEITKKPLPIHTFINRFISKEKQNHQIFFK